MSKLSNIVRNLSEENYDDIRDTLVKERADKSVHLLQHIRENKTENADVMDDLKLNANAYYTLRSRLGQKIEGYLVQKIQTPATDLLRKVSNVREVVFTEKRAIAVATLKKLEKELIQYNLYGDLALVYKYLKMFSTQEADEEHYSEKAQKYAQYAQQAEYAERLLTRYFALYSKYYLEGRPEDKDGLVKLEWTLKNVLSAHDFSHKLYVCYALVNIFHRLYVQVDASRPLGNRPLEPIENIFQRINGFFEAYPHDPLYGHLKVLVGYLRLCYYTQYGIYDKAEECYVRIEKSIPLLLCNYHFYTFPAHVLTVIFQRKLWSGNSERLIDKNKWLFAHYEAEKDDKSTALCFAAYKALCFYVEKEYRQAAVTINQFFNENNAKEFPHATLELKCLLALQYAILDEYDLFAQISGSIQRSFRLLGKSKVEHLVTFLKGLKMAVGAQKKGSKEKIEALLERFSQENNLSFCPLALIKMDDSFIEELCKSRSAFGWKRK